MTNNEKKLIAPVNNYDAHSTQSSISKKTARSSSTLVAESSVTSTRIDADSFQQSQPRTGCPGYYNRIYNSEAGGLLHDETLNRKSIKNDHSLYHHGPPSANLHDDIDLNFEESARQAEQEFQEARNHFWNWSEREQNWYHGETPENATIWYPRVWLAHHDSCEFKPPLWKEKLDQ